MRWLSPRAALATCLALCVSSASHADVMFWTGDLAAPYLDLIGDAEGATVAPVVIIGARNGTFSGKAVVCAAGSLKDVRATMSDFVLAGGKTRIAASQVEVRYATGWIKGGWQVQSKAGSAYDVLEPAPPAATVEPVVVSRNDKYHPWVKPGRAALPIWVTVHVPKDAAEGDYAGTLTVRADGRSQAFPVKLSVAGWTLPDAADFTTWIETIQSPDTLAMEYNVPLWSDKHWKLIEQSLRYGAMLGNKTVYFPLICETNFGNAESSVRWVKEGEGKYRYDLALVEKYLDLQVKTQGKPRIVCFPVWDTFLEGGQFSGDIKYEPETAREDRMKYQGKGPEITLAGPDGATTKLLLPAYSDAAAPGLWTPLWKQLAPMLAKRGLGGALHFGMGTDIAPPGNVVEMVEGVQPGAKWVIHSHSFYGGKDKKANFQYSAFVWGVNGFCTGAEGWKNPYLLTQFLRNMEDHWPVTTYRVAAEVNITGGQRGLGRIGLDYWRVVKDAKGRRMGQAWERYPKANWRNLNITCSLLAPGKDGPLATARFEMLREGVQECEARIFVQTALDGGKLLPATAAECRKVLADRDAFLNAFAITTKPRPWFESMFPSEESYMAYVKGWQEQSEKLYRAAADVARASAAR